MACVCQPWRAWGRSDGLGGEIWKLTFIGKTAIARTDVSRPRFGPWTTPPSPGVPSNLNIYVRPSLSKNNDKNIIYDKISSRFQTDEVFAATGSEVFCQSEYANWMTHKEQNVREAFLLRTSYDRALNVK